MLHGRPGCADARRSRRRLCHREGFWMSSKALENVVGVARSRLLPYRWELIVLLWLAYFLNQADRQIFNNLLPLIERDLGLTRTQLGLVASVFTLAYGLMVPVGGYAGDVLRRKWVVISALVVWSAATLLTGMSTGLVALIVFRGLATGGGEAFYYPPANSLIGQFHQETRALAMAIHQTSLYVGVTMSFLAGYVGEAFGWEKAFYLFGSFGLVLGLVMLFRLEDTPQPASSVGEKIRVGVAVRAISRKPTILFLCIGFASQVFVNVGYLTWMPTLLRDRYELSLTRASFLALACHHAAAFVGVVAGGRLSDRWARRRRSVRMEFEYAGLLLGAPFIALMGLTGSLPVCLAAVAGFGLFRGVYDSNLFAAPFDLVEPRLRSSMMGVMLAFAFVVGASAPFLLGWGQQYVALNTGIALLGLVYVVGGVSVFVALRTTFARDYYVAPDKL
jgi:sugar phosphate permease